MKNEIAMAFCVNNSYVRQLAVTLVSILTHNPNSQFKFYVFSSDFSAESQKLIDKLKNKFSNFSIEYIFVPKEKFSSLKLSIPYISTETYYRYVIADLLPDLDKILYLDADLIVTGDLAPLWNTELADFYTAGAADGYAKQIGHKSKIGLADSDLYVNAGVLLLNLKKLRRDAMADVLINKTIELFEHITFQDQDIINIVFKDRIKEFDNIYNFTSADVKAEKNKINSAVVIHYTGKNKPWQDTCRHKLKETYKKYQTMTEELIGRPLKVGLIIDEFFGGAATAFGGYGFLARKYIAKYIPCQDIQLDVLLGNSKKKYFSCEKYHEDKVDLYRLPKLRFLAGRWLKKQNYDVYLSIELTNSYVLECEPDKKKKLILWIQDPRPKSAWDNIINSMQSIKDPCFFSPRNYAAVHKWNEQKRVRFITQGTSLNPLAIELYDLPADTPIQYLPNPIDIDFDFKFDLSKKKKQVVFLGRLEAQKRAWLFCEVAKRMPDYDFYVIGKMFRFLEDNQRMLAPYMQGDIPNLHFMGHLDGEEKKNLIKESRVLLSTAIWEGIPISWLECLSYGTVLVSDLEREKLAEQFGIFVGDILGDGFDSVDKFIPVIRQMMEDDDLYRQKATAAIDYIRKTHNINRFTNDLRNVIYDETGRKGRNSED